MKYIYVPTEIRFSIHETIYGQIVHIQQLSHELTFVYKGFLKIGYIQVVRIIFV